MRIEGEGSEAAAAHSFSRCRDHGGTAGYRYLGSFLAFRRYARRGAKTLYCFSCCRLRRFFPVQRPWGDSGLPLPRIVFGVSSLCAPRCQNLVLLLLLPITPLNAA